MLIEGILIEVMLIVGMLIEGILIGHIPHTALHNMEETT